MSNGYRICDSCKNKFGWTSIETMAEYEKRTRAEYIKIKQTKSE
jgi:hypothetical protein